MARVQKLAGHLSLLEGISDGMCSFPKALSHKSALFIEPLISWTVGSLRLAAAPDTTTLPLDAVLQKPQITSALLETRIA